MDLEGNPGYMTGDPRMKYGDIALGNYGSNMDSRNGQGATMRMSDQNEVDPNQIKLKENGELDIDNMNEEQLYAHMIRL